LHHRGHVVFVFLHLPKTAGHSFTAVAARHFGADRVAAVNGPDDLDAFVRTHRRGRFALVHGHMPYGVAEHVGERGVYYVVLRDPVDRFVSDYYYIWGAPEHPAHRLVRERGITLRDFARIPSPVHPFTQNAQARRLCRYDLVRRNAGGGRWWALRHRFGAAELDEAKETLATRVHAFGLYERMPQSMRQFAALIGAELGEIPHENVTPFRLAVGQLDTETIDAIREANRLDLALYEFACRLADERSSALDRRRRPQRPAELPPAAPAPEKRVP
jgi:hypothetical protein